MSIPKPVPADANDRDYLLEFVRKVINGMKAETKYADDDPALQEILEYERHLQEMTFERA
jgi:hypothetical protein